MTLSPLILALLILVLLIAGSALYAGAAGARVALAWNPRTADPAQLRRERKASLLSALLGYVLALELVCLLTFLAAADHLHGLFKGAMCAAGTLNANVYGYPALVVLLLGFVASGLWLVINHLDTRSPNFPLLRPKYFLLAPLALLLGLQAWLVIRFLLALDPTLITSCCATVFDAEGEGLAAEAAHWPAATLRPLLWATWTATLLTGMFAYTRRPIRLLYAALSALLLPLSLLAVVSFIAVDYYELPTHHCPFCLLQPEYGHVGYVLYASLLLASMSGMGAGVATWLSPTRLPLAPNRMLPASWIAFLIFGGTAAWPRVFSDFTG